MDGIGNAGGIQEMALKWIKEFDPQKVHVDILSYDTGEKDDYPDRVGKYGCKIYIIPTYTRSKTFFKSFKETKKFFETHKDEYDIIHAHASAKAIFILWYAKKYGIKTRILHSHSSRIISNSILQKIAAILFKKPVNILVTDKFACSPEAGKYLFGEKAMKEGKVRIVHNAIDTRKFVYDEIVRNEMRRQLNVTDKFVIGNVGRFMIPKNHTFLIDIYAEICKRDNNTRLVLVGSGDLEDEMKKKCIELGIYNHVDFLGFRSDVDRIMQAFDLLVMPSLFEGLPVTSVEAQAIGIPTLFANTITKDAAILPQSDYMSLNESPERWADRILKYKQIKREKKPIKYLIEAGYDIEIETKKIEEFYMKKCEKKNETK